MLTFHWYLPTSGDSRDIAGAGHADVGGMASARAATLRYLTQIARAAEDLGFDGVLTPTGLWCEDAWLTTAALLPATHRLRFLVAMRPAAVSPTLAAQMAATYQMLSGGRLMLNVVTGGESAEQRAYGDFLDKDARYGRTDEFLSVFSALARGETVTHDTSVVHVEGAKLNRLPTPVPPIYLTGSSAAGIAVAAKHADVYLTLCEPLEMTADKLAGLAKATASVGRTVKTGVRMHIITRPTADAAWAEAARILATLDPERVAATQRALEASESEGQQRMRALHGGDREKLVVGPNLWAGPGLVRGGPGTALVGSFTEVADRIEEFAGLGLEEFVLSGYPHLEEAYWFAEGVLPILAARGLWQAPPVGVA